LQGLPGRADHAGVDRSQLLAQVPLFKGLPVPDRAAIAQRMAERAFGAGETVFRQGDRGASMFIVVAGSVQIFLPNNGPSKARLPLKTVEKGDYFGELAILDDKPRSASAETTAPTVLLELTREVFIADVIASPPAVLAILGEMGERLRDTNALLSQRAARDVVKEFDDRLTWGQRLADRVAALNGSWTFMLFLLALSAVWALANRVLAHPFDGYPYIFFNLLLALLVALQGPLIMMSQNRQAEKDRAQAANDFNVNLKNELGIGALLRELREFRRETRERLTAPGADAGSSRGRSGFAG
jgi:CRP/FNR family transcriptional regulator, cyclic AMP receptor protein